MLEKINSYDDVSIATKYIHILSNLYDTLRQISKIEIKSNKKTLPQP